ncbi:MAG: enoyl-CoA hydratase, partial [Rhodocyclaceae bacterium]|nr:enoyl-CoA hydratase [Rhodocyclaceae bacterium]
PPVRANELLYGGGVMTAEEALQYGLVNRVFPRDGFPAAALGFAAPFLGLSRAALTSTRKAVRLAAGKPFGAALSDVEAVYLKELMATADAKEGLEAFLAKRPAVWQHR